MKKVLVVFGTRPEAIKLLSVIRQLKKYPSKFKTIVCVTGQHRELLDQVLGLFKIKPLYDLNIMTNNQNLFQVTSGVLCGLKGILEKERPDIILVQGDTTTSFVASLAAFYLKIPIGHVEAGLRTYNKYSPFPEEKNRHLTAALADYHFAPTECSRVNLLKENIPEGKIWVTGNTIVDVLLTQLRRQKSPARQRALNQYFKNKWNLTLEGINRSKLILVTGHRRENFGEGLKNICLALKEIAKGNPDVIIVYAVHLNPRVRDPVHKILGFNIKGAKNIFLIDPLDYDAFVYLMNKSYLILTDSGGIQEEAPGLGKPVLVMRNTTERQEGIEAGIVKLVGTNKEEIVKETKYLLEESKAYRNMSQAKNPYGDGKAAQRIVNILKVHL